MNPTDDAVPPTPRPPLRRLLSSVPTLLVLAALTAVGVSGHRTGWRAPRLVTLLGGDGAAPREDWCSEHNVPESQCIACRPALAGANPADWCKEHGVPESRCTLCHPELLTKGATTDWCKEHGVPESSCPQCHPDLVRKGELPKDPHAPVVTAPDAAASAPDPRACIKHLLKVQFASPASLAKAGVALGQSVLRPMSDTVVVTAESEYDQTRYARVLPRAAGTVWRVLKNAGDPVQADEVLAYVDALEVGRAKAEYLQAVAAVATTTATATRLAQGSDAGLRTATELLEAQAHAREAEIRLFTARQALIHLGCPVPTTPLDRDAVATLGLPAELVAAAPAGTLSANLMALRAPFAGTVVARTAVQGQLVDLTTPLFEIADTRRMWVTLHVPPGEVRRLATGQQVLFRPDDARDDTVAGSLTWIATAVDDVTRTIEARAEIDTPDRALRAHVFGRAQVIVRKNQEAVAVPSEAVQWEGCCHVVFVRQSDTVFSTRKVRLGGHDAAFTEILAGVAAGEVLATTGSHVLKSEILKSQLGAGCADDH